MLNTKPAGLQRKAKQKPLSSLLYCADCVFRMKASKSTNKVGYTTGNPHIVVWESYICGTYSHYGKDYCSSHYIEQAKIEHIVLNDIRAMMTMVTVYEETARKAFLSRKQKNINHQISSDKEKLQTAKKRITELDRLMQSAYEDKVSGEMPASVCAKLLEKYEVEQNERDVDEFIARLKKYRDAEVLTREMCLALVDAVTIDKFVKGKQERDIHIYYKFIDKGYSGKIE